MRTEAQWPEYVLSGLTLNRYYLLPLDAGTVTIWYENGVGKSVSTPRRRAVLSQTDKFNAWRGKEVVFCCGVLELCCLGSVVSCCDGYCVFCYVIRY